MKAYLRRLCVHVRLIYSICGLAVLFKEQEVSLRLPHLVRTLAYMQFSFFFYKLCMTEDDRRRTQGSLYSDRQCDVTPHVWLANPPLSFVCPN